MRNLLNTLKFYGLATAIAMGLILLGLGIFSAQANLATPEGWFGLWYSAAQVSAANAAISMAIFGGLLAGASWVGVLTWRYIFPRQLTKEEMRVAVRQALREPVGLPETSSKEALDEVSREPVLVH